MLSVHYFISLYLGIEICYRTPVYLITQDLGLPTLYVIVTTTFDG
jgi:hypothetical protein